MNQELRNRRAIDLDELERQLRLSAEPNERAHASDPLAELARLVGQEDPFKDVFARPAPQAPAAADRRIGQEQIDLLNQFDASKRPELRPAHDFDAPHQPQHPDLGDYHHEAPPVDDYYEPAHPPAPVYAEPLQPRKAGGFRKRNLVLAFGMVGVAGLGIFAAFGMRSHSLLPKSSDVPMISAKNAPVKERPENPGGAEVPNQNKQIYDAGATTTGSAGSAKVVNSVEQPVDLSTAPRAAVPRVVLPGPATLPGGGQPPSADASAAAPTIASMPGVPSAEPKRVRSVAIKVGDSNDAAPQPAPAASPAPAPTPAPTPSIASLIAPTPASSDTPTSASVPLPPPQRPRAAVATPETPSSGAVSAQPKPTPSTPAPKPAPKVAKKAPAPVESAAPTAADDADAPLALSPPKVRPGQQRTASAEPKTTASSGSGGWTVQLASRPSQADASSAASQLAQKFSGQLGGARPGVVHGEAGGKSVYRVRVGSYDKDRAAEVCNQVKAAGGNCFIAKN